MKISAFGIYYLILLVTFGLLCGGLMLAARFGKPSKQDRTSDIPPKNEMRWHPVLCVFFAAVFLGAIPFIIADMDNKKNEVLGYASIFVIICFAIGFLWGAVVIARANRKAMREIQEEPTEG